MIAFRVCRLQFHSKPVLTVDGSDPGIQPPHMNGHHLPRPHRLRIFQTAQNKTIAHLFLEIFKLVFPFRRDWRRFHVHRGDMPAQRLGKNVGDIVAIFFPARRCPTRFQRNRAALPYILNSGLRNLLWIYVEHFWLKIWVIRFCTHVPEAVQPPASTMLCSIGQCLRLIEIHQQRCAMETH